MIRQYLSLLAFAVSVAVADHLAARATAPLYGQCGGSGWTGATTCVANSVCTYSNPYYSQCLPGNGTPATTSTTAAPTSTPVSTGSLPSSFKWSSTGPLIGPKNDGTNLAGIKDPSVIYYNNHYHVFASTVSDAAGYSLVYMNFTDWSAAGNAPFYYLKNAPLGTGYRAAPEIFFFTPHNLWYLIYQNGNSAYSTNPDISNPAGWTAPQNFFPSEPSIIQQNIGSGSWVDMWVICDSSNCHLFSSDDNGHLYRSQTPLSSFPNGMSQPIIAMEDTADIYELFEASNVYHYGNNQYLLIVEAIGTDGHRYFRSWTMPNIAGPYTALADDESNPFARSTNVAFTGTPWTTDISHGEMVRNAGYDETLTINPCNLQYLYQGDNPANTAADYNSIPWRLALLTQTNSAC